MVSYMGTWNQVLNALTYRYIAVKMYQCGYSWSINFVLFVNYKVSESNTFGTTF